MSAAQLGLLGVAYGVIYTFLARGAISGIVEVDPAFKDRWPKPSWFDSPRTSGAVFFVMFNMNLPKDEYPGSLQLRIWSARVMLWLWPVVIFLVLVFMPHNRH